MLGLCSRRLMWKTVSKNRDFVYKSFHAVANELLNPSIRVRLVPIFDDNYSYLIVDDANQTMVCVDPADPDKMIQAVEEEEKELLAVLTTHKHMDHVAGNNAIAAAFRGIQVYGPAAEREHIPALTHAVSGGDQFNVAQMQVEVMSTPCHTSGHVMYLLNGGQATGGRGGAVEQDVEQPDPPLLFSGDTLFVGGCGRFFEGDGADMWRALKSVRELPPQTRVYCGHEYTESNLAFAASVEPSNTALASKQRWAKQQRQLGRPTVPSTVGDELAYNPFMRVTEASVIEAVRKGGGGVALGEGAAPEEVMSALRLMKDTF